jgi:cyclase
MTKAFLVRILAAAISAGGLWVAMTQPPPAQPLTVEKIADDFHVIVGSGGNVAVLTTADGMVLVDDKFERNIPEILAKVKSISGKPIKYFLNTHHHGDHTGGNRKLMESPVEIIAHNNARANMVKASQPGQPRITFSDETAVFLGGKEVQARLLGRGHTNGDAVIYFPAHKVIHTGDLFVNGAPFIDYSNGGSGLAWTNTFDEIPKIDFVTIIPGHGNISKREDLVKWKKSFETMRGRVSELKRQGKPKEEVAKLLKLDDLGWQAGGLLARSLPGLYDEVK